MDNWITVSRSSFIFDEIPKRLSPHFSLSVLPACVSTELLGGVMASEEQVTRVENFASAALSRPPKQSRKEP